MNIVHKFSHSAICAAASALESGQLVAIPTETVYGLGADARNDEAVARIFEAKGRPRFNPLIVHVADLEKAEKFCVFNKTALKLAQAFWPGPLTLVLPRRADSGLSLLVSAGLDTVAIRVPDAPVAEAVLEEFGGPIAAPSANRSGHVSPTQASHVAEELGDSVAMVLDGGPCKAGVESTIVSVADDCLYLLRPGPITPEDLETATGLPVRGPNNIDTNRPVAPGQLESHYAPSAAVRLNADRAKPGEALLAFGPDAPTGENVMNLSKGRDLREAAANLFAMLRTLDERGFATIAVMPIPEDGLGLAINDRLQRAAAPRPDPEPVSAAREQP
jgi:L-threonylcarbamoyladenylate synthase